MNKLKRSRKNLSEEEFILFFAKNEMEKEVVKLMYKEIIYWFISSDHFPIHPDDRFFMDYKVDEDDFEDCLKSISKKLSFSSDSLFAEMKNIPMEKITVGYIVSDFLEIYRSRN